MLKFKEFISEALTVQQRRQRARMMKRYASKIARGRERSKRKTASLDVLKNRARKTARNQIFQKLAKDTKGELSYARRTEIEKRMKKMNKRIERLAKKMIPQVRKIERERKRSR